MGGPDKAACLASSAIVAPFLLKGGSRSSQRLLSHVTLRSGSVQLLSGSAAGRETQHLTGLATWTARRALWSKQATHGRSYNASEVLRHTLQRPQAVKAGSWQGAATACVCLQAVHAFNGGYRAHPSAADAATHPGALLDVARHDQPRVPVALQCYYPPAEGLNATPSSRFVSATDGALLVGGSRLSSFALEGSRRGSDSLALTGLMSKSFGAKQCPAVEPLMQYEQHCHSYALQWQVTTSVGSPSHTSRAQLPFSRTAMYCTASSLQLVQHSRAASQPPLVSYAVALEILLASRAARQLPFLTVSVDEPEGMHPTPLGRGPCWHVGSSVTSGLLRVAALEEPDWKLQQIHIDISAHLDAKAVATLLQPDAHGAAVAACAGTVPRMLPVQRHPIHPVSSAATHTAAGQHIITGGLGGLGILTGMWKASNVWEGAAVTLLGRSGLLSANYTLAARELLNADCMVCLARCDVAVAADAEVTSQVRHVCVVHGPESLAWH